MRRLLGLAILVLLLPASSAALSPPSICMRKSGDAGTRCLGSYVGTVEECRFAGSASCETAVRADGGALDEILARTADKAEARCTEDSAFALGYTSLDDVGLRVPELCRDFGDDLLDIAFDDTPNPAFAACQRVVARSVDRLRKVVVHAFGKCDLATVAGPGCNRQRRDASIDRAATRTRARIIQHCDSDFFLLHLVPPAATLTDAVDALLDVVVQRSRHYAQHVYPPHELGPTAEFGPFPVGVTTLALADASRMNVQGTGPRPVTVEVYYPSSPAAIVGVPKDVVQVFGIDIVATPAYRDVALAPGARPLIVFSHGNNGIRFQSFFFAAHLASHGYIVVSPDHHGNTFVDSLMGIVDPNVAVNRPLDVSFLIDQFLAFNTESGNFFEDAVDPDRIGVSGHSFGGYTTFAVAGGTFPLGTFTDSRVKAIIPQAPASSAGFFPDDFFSTIHIPTLVIGGSIDVTTPFAANQQRAFDLMPSGATVVALADLIDAGHFTFSDFCEVPRDLLAFLGGFDEACTPAHLPWRHAHRIVNYLSLNFFDGVLNGDADALARLAPANVASIEDLVYESK